MRALAFATLVAALPVAATEDPLADCRVMSPGSPRMMQCAGYLLGYADFENDGLESPTLEAFYLGMVGAVKSATFETADRKKVKVAGVERPAFTAKGFAEGKPVVFARVVGVPVPSVDQRLRGITCVAMLLKGGAIDGCSARLDALAALPALELPPAQRVTIKGAELEVPAGCKGNSQGMQCGSTSLTLRSRPDQAMTLNQILPAAKTALEREGKLDVVMLGCTLGGQSAECALLAPAKGEKRQLYDLIALSQTTMAECTATTDPRKAMPKPCELALTLTK